MKRYRLTRATLKLMKGRSNHRVSLGSSLYCDKNDDNSDDNE